MRDTVREAIAKQVAARGLENIKNASVFALELQDANDEILDEIKQSSLALYCRVIIKEAKQAKEAAEADMKLSGTVNLTGNCANSVGYVQQDSLANMDEGVLTTSTAIVNDDGEPEWMILGVSPVEFASDVVASPLTYNEVITQAEEDAIMAEIEKGADEERAKEAKALELEERLCRIEDFLGNLGLEFSMFAAE